MNIVHYISGLIWQTRSTYFLALLFLLLESATSYSLIYVQKILIDEIFYAGKYEWTPAVVAVFAGIGVLHVVMITLTHRQLVSNEFKVSGVLIDRMLRALENTKVGAFTKERHGNFVHIMTSDLFFGASFIGWQTPRAIQEAMSLAIMIGVVSWASPTLLLLVIVLCMLYLAVTWYFMTRLRDSNREVSRLRSELLVQIEEGIASTREIIAYHRLKWEEALFNSKFNRYFQQTMRHGKLENRQMRWSDPLKWGVGIAVLAYGGYQLMRGFMSVGTFVVVFQFATLMSDAFFRLFQYIMMISGNIAHHERMHAIINMEKDDPGSIALREPVKSIRFDRIAFRYEPEMPRAIVDLSAELPSGRKIAIIGKSGSGKSTIAQLLARFHEPESGGIWIDDKPLVAVSREDWCKRTTVVFQEPYLLPDTIRTNIMLGRPGLTEQDMIEACKIAQIHDFICGLPDGYDTQIGERGIKLSGGQRQRIAIARAIITDPEILVLDEATSALDLETERRLMKQLDARRQGKTTIVIAHRLSTIENADLILVMDNGRLAGIGSEAQALANLEAYQELVAVQTAK